MKLVVLQQADICRDGGSYVAHFLADDGNVYGLWLRKTGLRPSSHYRWLFQYRAENAPHGCIPVVSGSSEESEILRLLDDFLRAPAFGPWASADSLYQLREMRRQIPMRDTCTPEDVLRYVQSPFPA